MADGTGIAVINPWFPINGAYIANGNTLPFITVASGSSILPFAASVPAYGAAGPFNAITSSMSTFITDSVSVDFI